MNRRLNTTNAFYVDGKTGETLNKHELSTKVLDIVSDFGPYKEMYTASLIIGSQHLLDFGPNILNKPFDHLSEEKIDYSIQLKDLKKDTKNFKYTKRILRNSDGVFVTNL